MQNWKITGIIATLVIVLSIPAYMLKRQYLRQPPAARPPADFVGGQKCAECHKSEFDKWRGSHHDLAMDVANDSTVLGNFDNAAFERFGVTSRFYRQDGRSAIPDSLSRRSPAMPAHCLGCQRKKMVSSISGGPP